MDHGASPRSLSLHPDRRRLRRRPPDRRACQPRAGLVSPHSDGNLRFRPGIVLQHQRWRTIMRDDIMRDGDEFRPLPLAVMVQPDPMLEEHPAGPLRILATMLGAGAIVVLALYGMTRSPEPQQMAAAAETQTAP